MGDACACRGGEGRRVLWVVDVARVEEMCDGGDGGAEEADRVETVGVGDDAPAGYEAVGGLEADDVVVGRGETH